MDENLVVIRMKVRKFEKSVVVRKLRLLPRCGAIRFAPCATTARTAPPRVALVASRTAPNERLGTIAGVGVPPPATAPSRRDVGAQGA